MATTKKTNLATARATTRRGTKSTAPKAKRATKPAAKANSKAAPKRSTHKATATKTPSAVVANPAEAFWVCDGTVLHSLAELADVLERMDAATYAHHANKEKHDFAAWVEQVFGMPTLATALRRTKTPRSAKLAVRKYV